MAKKNKSSKRYGYDRNKRSKEIQKFAYNVGLIERGLKNPDSLISASHKRGLTEPKYDNKKKTLF